MGAALLAGAMMFAVAACGKPAQPTQQPGQAQPPAKSEKVVRYNVGADPKSLDPAEITALTDFHVVNQLFEGLVRLDKDNKEVPGMATKWTVSGDGLKYVFELRDAKWSTGDPVTAQDFEYAWKRALDPRNGFEYAYQLYYIKGGEDLNSIKFPSEKDEKYKDKKDQFEKDKAEATKKVEDAMKNVAVKAVNDKTLEVTLVAPTPYFLGLTAFPTLMPVSKKVAEKTADWHAKADTYVSNGPFKLTEWKRKDSLTMVKNTAYWDAATVKLDKLFYTMVEEESTELTLFDTDKIDITHTVPKPEIPRLKADPKSGFQPFPMVGMLYYAINMRKPEFKDVRVRKALTLAIDRKTLAENVWKGTMMPAYAVVPPGIPDAEPGSEYRKVGGNLFKEDVAEAKKLLAEAGFPDGKGFPELTIMYNTNEAHKATAEAVADMWKKNLGIQNVKLANQEWKVFQKTRSNAQYQVARHGWIGDYLDPMTFMDLWITEPEDKLGTTNNDPKYANPKYDQLIKDAKKSPDNKVRMKNMHDAEKLILEEFPIIPLLFYTDPILVKPYVKGYVKNALGNLDFKWADIQK